MMETVGVTGELKASAPIARKTTAKRENWALGVILYFIMMADTSV